MHEMRVRPLGLEDPLEEGMATSLGFLPGESDGQRSLAGYSPWGHKELAVAEAEAPILWPPDAENQLICEDSDTGKVEGRRRG